jgi:hypothetical protein
MPGKLFKDRLGLAAQKAKYQLQADRPHRQHHKIENELQTDLLQEIL